MSGRQIHRRSPDRERRRRQNVAEQLARWEATTVQIVHDPNPPPIFAATVRALMGIDPTAGDAA